MSQPTTPQTTDELTRRISIKCIKAIQFATTLDRQVAMKELTQIISTELCELVALATRAYPDLKHSGMCSAHRDSGHYSCLRCYPDLNALLRAHMEVSNELYASLLDISGIKEPPSGRVGTNAILLKLRERVADKDASGED